MEQLNLFDTSAACLKSPLKWAGGKSTLIKKVRKLWIDSRCDRWVDLFVGGGSLPLALAPKKVLINDANEHLISFWKWLQNDGGIGVEFRNDADFYYQMRSQFNQSPTPEIFYYLNRTGFNGLCRYNKNGGYNVPFGKYKTINYRVDFSEYKAVIAGWEITNKSFQDIQLEPNDLVFADPPYDDGFVNYSKEGFTWENQVELATKLSKHEGMVIATNKATNRVIELYLDLGFQVEIIDMPRKISCNGDRTPAKEMFAIKRL